jgi:DASH complex subunit DAD3
MKMTAQTRKLSEAPDENLLARLRVLERKMGLVLTLVMNDAAPHA